MPRASIGSLRAAGLMKLPLLGAVALMVAVFAIPAQALAGVGKWRTTGAMAEPRTMHTATLLSDGTVLVAGGESDPCAGGCPGLASAELYDPDSSTWRATGSMTTTRYQHTATRLLDGSVLATGGFTRAADGVQGSAELYDHASGAWRATAAMSTPRVNHTATLLPDGRVLVVGGAASCSTGCRGLASAELYDPATGSWQPTGSLGTARFNHTATLLPDGRVLVAGGASAPIDWLASAELYDPATGTWQPTGSMAAARNGHTDALLSGGTVVVVGGVDEREVVQTERYDPATGSWRTTGNPTFSRGFGHTTTVLRRGNVLVAGGTSPFGNAQDSSEIYDPLDESWAMGPAMSESRRDHTATRLFTGRVLVAGGRNSLGTALTSAELFVSNSQ